VVGLLPALRPVGDKGDRSPVRRAGGIAVPEGIVGRQVDGLARVDVEAEDVPVASFGVKGMEEEKAAVGRPAKVLQSLDTTAGDGARLGYGVLYEPQVELLGPGLLVEVGGE
jgi:hypothetical protein